VVLQRRPHRYFDTVLPPLYDSHFFRPDTVAHPIFVVGLPRSGTTMLRLMLHQHPDVAVLSETWFGPRVWDRRWGFPVRQASEPFLPRLLDDFIHLLETGGREDFPLDLADYRQRVLDGPAHLNRLLSVLGDAWAAREGASRWGEKSPVHLRHMPVLSAMFPFAVFVHIVRDFRDTVASLVTAPFSPMTDPVAFAVECRRGMESAERDAGALSPTAGYVLLRYEDVVEDPTRALISVCDAVGVPFHPGMLDFHLAAERYAPRQAWMAGVHEPLNTASTGRWRRDLAPEDALLVEAVLDEQLRRFDYAPGAREADLAGVRATVSRLVSAHHHREQDEQRSRQDWIGMHRGTYKALLEDLDVRPT
jgi:hypothetical protein